VAFATSATYEEQQQALYSLHDTLVNSLQPAGAAGGSGKLLSMRDTNTLLSVGGQRLRGCFSQALERFNASRLEGNTHVTFLLTDDSEERRQVLQLLQMLKILLVPGDNDQALLLVSERIPSTLVKVVKALSDGGEPDKGAELVKEVLQVLALVVTSPEVVQELNESSTLHRIFHLAFEDEILQLAVVKVVWDWIWCLLDC
jgi:hypothetical protein